MKNDKQQKFFEWVRETEADIVGVGETGLNWGAEGVGPWRERAKGQFQHERSVWAHNTEDPIKTPTQWGGTGMVTVGRTTAKIDTTGKDWRGLGRWAWTKFRGETPTYVVSMYQPVANTTGPTSVYQVQKGALLDTGEQREPREVFRQDADQQLKAWVDTGAHVIVMADINEPTEGGELAKVFETAGLQYAMQGLQGFATYKRNTNNKIIDGIWTTPGVAVRQRGFTEFHHWDHRTAWIDIDTAVTFGTRKMPDLHLAARRLRTQDGDSVRRYQKEYLKTARAAKLAERAAALDRAVDRTMTPTQREELEKLDAERTTMMKAAEKKCRMLRTGAVPYSPGTLLPAWQVAFWKLAIKRRDGGQVSSRRLQRSKDKAQINTQTRNMTRAEMTQALAEAQDRWSKAKTEAAPARKAFLLRQAELYASEHNVASEKAVTMLMKRESDRTTWRRIRWALQGEHRTGITHVTEKTESGERITHEHETDIVRCCITENRKKYRQTEGTPFMTAQMTREFGTDGLTEAGRAVVQGKYDDKRIRDETTKAFIKELHQPATVSRWTEKDLHISLDEHKQAWRRARERTASGPSNLHFGMWKVNAMDDYTAELDRIMRAIPFRTGYVMNRWKQGVDVELCKQQGNFDVTRLRTIVLLEADYNLNNKTMSRRVAQKAEQGKAFAEEQYGSRNGHSAPDVSLNNRLTDDIMRQTRRGGAVVSNDAKSCYDRIVHAVLSLCLQRMGVAEEPIRSLIGTMQQLTHHVKTAYGTSTATYRADEKQTPMQGILQGNAMGPMGWGAVSTPLIKMMTTAGFGFHHWNAIQKETVDFACFAYVDDTDLVHSKGERTTSPEFIEEVQQAINLWEGGLRVTGGALAPQKSYWYWIDYKWEGGQWKYKTKADMPGEVTMRDPNGQQAPLTRLEANESRRALGVMPRRDGSEDDNLAYLKAKGRKWADRIRTSSLTRAEAWRAAKATIWRTFAFPTRSMCATKPQLRTASGEALQTALRKAGIQRCFPRDLVYGDAASLGLGIHEPHTLQTIAHLQAVLQHGHKRNLTGKLLRASYEAVRTEMGDMGDVFRNEYDKWKSILTDSWWQATWRDMTSYNIRLRPPRQHPRESAWREQDQQIMTVFVNGGAKGATLRKLNRCRMELQVVWVSEITEASGRKINARMLHAGGRPAAVRPAGTWPKTAPTIAADWAAWRRAIREHLLEPMGSHLRVTLGKFYPDTPGEREWEWWASIEGDTVWQRSTDIWTEWPRQTRKSFRRGQERTPTNVTLRRATVGPISPEGVLHIVAIDGRPTHPRVDIGDTTPTWSTQDSTANMGAWADAIRAGLAVAVCDGSWKDNFGAAAFRLGKVRRDRWHRVGEGTTWIKPGLTATGSHRAELAGIHGIISTTVQCAGMYGLQVGRLILGCDNQAALRSLDRDWDFASDDGDYDILVAIQDMVRQLDITVQGKHVKGHQDSTGRRLTQWEQWNVDMDKVAKAAWRHYALAGKQDANARQVGGPAWSATLGDVQIQDASIKALYPSIVRETTRAAWKRYLKVDQGWESVDWGAIKSAGSRVGESTRIWVAKHVSGNSGTSATLVRWKYRASAQCPRCAAPKETADHVNECKGRGTRAIWEAYEERIQEVTRTHGVDPEIRAAILRNLRKWRAGARPVVTHSDQYITTALTAQKRLGWGAFVKGFIAEEWREAQRRTVASMVKKRATAWVSRMVEGGWQYMQDMWRHRNEALHEPDGEATRQMEAALDRAIREEKDRGPGGLAEGVVQMWGESWDSLQARPVDYRKRWLRLVWAGRRPGQPVAYGEATSGLEVWMATGRL